MIFAVKNTPTEFWRRSLQKYKLKKNLKANYIIASVTVNIFVSKKHKYIRNNNCDLVKGYRTEPFVQNSNEQTFEIKKKPSQYYLLNLSLTFFLFFFYLRLVFHQVNISIKSFMYLAMWKRILLFVGFTLYVKLKAM